MISLPVKFPFNHTHLWVSLDYTHHKLVEEYDFLLTYKV